MKSPSQENHRPPSTLRRTGAIVALATLTLPAAFAANTVSSAHARPLLAASRIRPATVTPTAHQGKFGMDWPVLAGGTRRYIINLSATAPVAGAHHGITRSVIVNNAREEATVSSVISALHGTVTRDYRFTPSLAANLTSAQAAALRSNHLVTAILPDFLMATSGTIRRMVNPPSPSQADSIVGSDDANAVGLDGQGQTIAIVDTGVDSTHPYLSGRIVDEACFATAADGSTGACPNGKTSDIAVGAAAPCSGSGGCTHGTFVAGVAAGANGNDGTYTLNGIAPAATIDPIQVFHVTTDTKQNAPCAKLNISSPCALNWTSDLKAALEWIYGNRANYSYAAVNMSLGSGQFNAACDSNYQGTAQYLTDDMNNLRTAGITPVIAAGNNGYTSAEAYPACISSAVSVGATDLSGNIASYSDMANETTLLAPGSSVESSSPGNKYVTGSGTSFSAPVVAGAIALLRERVPDASIDWMIAALENPNSAALITDKRTNGYITKPQINVYNSYIVHSIEGDDSEDEATALHGSGSITSCSTATTGDPDNPVYFTKNVHEDNHAGNRGGASAWFKYYAPDDGILSVNTIGSNFDTLLAVYNQNDLNTALAADDDYNGHVTSAVSLRAVAGDTYEIALDGYRGPADTNPATGNCQLNWSFTAQRPANDDQANAQVISGGSGIIDGNNFQATIESGERAAGGHSPVASIWYKWVAPATGTVEFSTAESSIPTFLEVLTGQPGFNNQALVTYNGNYGSSNQSRVKFTAGQGYTYWIDVDTVHTLLEQQAPEGSIRLQWAQNSPTNDDFANATALTGNFGTIAGDNSLATAEPGEPEIAGPGDPTVTTWYSYHATETGTFTVNVAQGDFDSILTAFTGTSVSGLAEVATNDNLYADTALSGLTFNVTSGVTYDIAVDGAPNHNRFAFLFDPPGGSYTLSWALNSPVNDSFLTPVTLASSAGSVRGDSSRSTAQPTEGATDPPNLPQSTLWYVWTAPSTAAVTFSASSSTFAPALAIWSGEVGGLSRLDSNGSPAAGKPATLVMTPREGVQYVISIDGAHGGRGKFTLAWGPRARLGVNLLVNAGADSGIGATTDTTVSIPAWTATGGLTATTYTSGLDLSRAATGTPDPGLNYFYGGPDNAFSSATQTIGVSSMASMIAKGKIKYTLGGWLGGFLTQDDAAKLTVTFANKAGNTVATYTIAGPNAAARSDLTELLHKTHTAKVPKLTTSAVVTLSMVRANGSDNDGLADDLALTFHK